jgi:Dolichyl-phosphate-mannose-protein mannosyltransferase
MARQVVPISALRVDVRDSFGVSLAGLLFVAGTLGRAQQKLFWHDEIFTAVVAALPRGEVWGALRDGLDLSAPGFHVLTRISQAIFGSGLLGTRMPALIGVFLAAVCAGIFVRRRYGAAAGLCSMLLLLCGDAYFYAYEARPYGPLLGFAGAALVCWQSAVSAVQRRAWLAGLFASLAAALACHYYAVLLFIPIGLAELARFSRTRTPDWPLWLSVCGSLLLLVPFLPLIASVGQYSVGHFAPPQLRTVVNSYESTASELAVPLLLTLLAAGTRAFRSARSEEARDWSATSHEWVLATAMTLLPVFAFVLAMGWTNALEPRYYLPWTLGFSILVPLTIAELSRYGRRIVVTLAAALFLWFGARQAMSARWLAHESPELRSVYPQLFDPANGTWPIVIGHPHVYLVAAYYAEPALQRRLVTLTRPGEASSPDGALYISTRSFRAMAKRLPLQLEDFDAFTARHSIFFLYGPSSDWLIGALRARGAVLILRGADPDTQRFPMSRPAPSYWFFEVRMPHASG